MRNPADDVLLSTLSKIPPLERKKTLLLLAELVHSSGLPFIQEQLSELSLIAVDPDWVATIKNNVRLAELRRKMARVAQDLTEGLR